MTLYEIADRIRAAQLDLHLRRRTLDAYFVEPNEFAEARHELKKLGRLFCKSGNSLIVDPPDDWPVDNIMIRGVPVYPLEVVET